MNHQFVLLFLFLFTLLNFSESKSQIISEIQLYKRCYNHLVQKPVPLNDPRAQQIKFGQLTATRACTDLINSVELRPDGNLNTNSSEALSVLRTFNLFHRSFFQVNSMDQIPDNTVDFNRGTDDAFDPSEPSMTITYNLLRNEAFRNVLAYKHGIKGIRVNDSKKSLIAGFGASPSPRLIHQPLHRIIHRPDWPTQKRFKR